MRKTFVLILAGLVIGLFSGCSWESGGPTDAGDSDSGNGGDDDILYPPPPYGVDFGETMANLEIERVTCQGEDGIGRPLEMAEFLDAKAMMITVHAGWCSVCKVQSSTMERDIQTPYHDQGLEVLLIMIQDENSGERRQDLLDYTCTYRQDYGLTVNLAIDPGAAVMSDYFRPTEAGTPLNMLLDDDMEIRYKLEGLIPDSYILEGTIEGLLNE